MNFSANGWGEPDARAQALRELNRNADFRLAVTSAMDRVRLGESLVRGPFTAVYPGGIYRGSAYYDNNSTVYYPLALDVAKAALGRAGLVDTDGNGFVNFPADVMGGADVEITLLANTDIRTDRNVAEAVVTILADAGLKVLPSLLPETQYDATQQAGQFDWLIYRNKSELVTVVQNTAQLAPIGPQTSIFHRAGTDGTVDLLPFEQEMVDIVNTFISSSDPEEKIALMRKYQKIYTQNVYGVGLTQYSAALIVNKRFANLPVGTPNFMFNWGEDSVMRERMYVPLEAQKDYELFPGTLPGAPGAAN